MSTTDPAGENLPGDMVARIRSGEGERITYADLVKKAQSPLL